MGDHRLPDSDRQLHYGGFLLPPLYHNAGPYFRTIPLLPEGGGRVEEVFVRNGEAVSAGDPLFSLLDSAQVAGVNVAESQLAQITSAFAQAEVQLEGARATLTQAESALAQAENELAKKTELSARGQQLVSKIEIERLENTCLLYTSPSPRDRSLSRMPSSA